MKRERIGREGVGVGESEGEGEGECGACPSKL